MRWQELFCDRCQTKLVQWTLVHYLVEADLEEEARERLCIYLCDPDSDNNAEGMEEIRSSNYSKGETK